MQIKIKKCDHSQKIEWAISKQKDIMYSPIINVQGMWNDCYILYMLCAVCTLT